MSREITAGEVVLDQFPVFDFDGYTKVSGLVQSDFVVSSWIDSVSISIPVVIAEISGGEYSFSFTPTVSGHWKIEIFVNYSKDVLGFEYVASAVDFRTGIARLLGLSHENVFIDRTEYDSNNQMVSARVRLFDSKVNCDLATMDGSETLGLIASYSLDTQWEAINKFGLFKQVRDV